MLLLGTCKKCLPIGSALIRSWGQGPHDPHTYFLETLSWNLYNGNHTLSQVWEDTYSHWIVIYQNSSVTVKKRALGTNSCVDFSPILLCVSMSYVCVNELSCVCVSCVYERKRTFCVCVYVCACTPTHAPEVEVQISVLICSSVFWDKVPHWNRGSSLWLHWLTREVRGILLSLTPSYKCMPLAWLLCDFPDPSPVWFSNPKTISILNVLSTT